jgi:hypothetical protein
MAQEPEILNSIPVEIDLEELQQKLHLKPGDQFERLLALIDEARPLIRPQAVYRASFISEKLSDAVIIDGTTLKSAILRKQLDEVERVFPYVMTIGPRLEQRAAESGDYLEQYYLDTIANVALIGSRRHLEKHIRSRYGLEKISRMGPGSLEAWPISEQRPLFSILGDVASAVAVTLTENFLMMPKKSSSGIYFPTEVPFFSCQLCPREKCPSRKAAYDQNKAREYGI